MGRACWALLVMALLLPLSAAAEGTPEQKAIEVLEAWAEADVEAFAECLADPTARDLVLLFAERVQDPDRRREILFGNRRLRVLGLQITNVNSSVGVSQAQVNLAFYFAEREKELGQRVYPLLRGAYVAETDPGRCAGHGDCVAVCPFEARALVEGKSRLVQPCFGCGLCADVCPERAIVMHQA